MFIVIDKSWLIGTRIDKIVEIASHNTLLMPAVLGYELFTAEDESQKTRSWEKLKAVESSIYLIDHIGSLLKYEFENHTPCTPIEDRRYKIDFSFNPRLTQPNFPFTGNHKKDIQYFSREWEILNPHSFKARVPELHNVIPEAEGIEGSTYNEIEPILRSLTDVGRIKQIYTLAFRNSNSPPVEKINEDWAYFRWLQVWLMAAVEHRRKFGAGEITISEKRLANECIDISYCITGILSGALATGEKNKSMGLYFRLCCPDGVLI